MPHRNGLLAFGLLSLWLVGFSKDVKFLALILSRVPSFRLLVVIGILVPLGNIAVPQKVCKKDFLVFIHKLCTYTSLRILTTPPARHWLRPH